MTQTVFEKMKTEISVLKLDFTTKNSPLLPMIRNFQKKPLRRYKLSFPTSVKRNSRPPSKHCSS